MLVNYLMAMASPRNPEDGGLGKSGYLLWDCNQSQRDHKEDGRKRCSDSDGLREAVISSGVGNAQVGNMFTPTAERVCGLRKGLDRRT